MNIKITFLENDIVLSNQYVRCLEIENKDYFYRIVNNINKYSIGDLDCEILIDKKLKIKVIIDYFNIDFNDKKVISGLNKKFYDEIDEETREKLVRYYNKLVSVYEKLISENNIGFSINREFSFENLFKLVNLKVVTQNNLLNNLCTFIDIQKELGEYDLLVFVNLKEYLTSEEIEEFNKYAVYNGVTILLIDNRSYGVQKDNEKKIIIDENLDEFVI